MTIATTTPAALAIAARYLLRPFTGYTWDHRAGGTPYLECTPDPARPGGFTVTGGVVLRPRNGSGAVHRWTRISFTGGGACGVWSGSDLNAFTGLAPRKGLPAPVDPEELPLGAVARRMGDLEGTPRGVTVHGTAGLDALAALAPKLNDYRYRVDGVHTTGGGVYATDGRAAIRLQGTFTPGPDGAAPTFTVARDVVASALAAVKRYRAGHGARLVCSPDGDLSGVELHGTGGGSALFAAEQPLGEFPDVDAVIPADGECTRRVELPAGVFTASELTAAGRAFRRSSDRKPVLAITPAGSAVITATPDSYPGALHLDPTYIALAARALGGFPLRFDWSGPARPCRVTGPEGVAVVMPLAVER